MKNKIFIITGQQGSGKTTFLINLIRELKKYEVTVSGILSEGFWDQNVRSRFELIDLTTGTKMLFCTRDEHPGWENTGHFYFNPEALTFGKRVLLPSGLKNAQVIAIDEVGPFELQGDGWSKAIENIAEELPQIPLILIVRKSLLKSVIDNFGMESVEIIPAENIYLNESVDKVVSAIRNKENGLS